MIAKNDNDLEGDDLVFVQAEEVEEGTTPAAAAASRADEKNPETKETAVTNEEDPEIIIEPSRKEEEEDEVIVVEKTNDQEEKEPEIIIPTETAAAALQPASATETEPAIIPNDAEEGNVDVATKNDNQKQPQDSTIIVMSDLLGGIGGGPFNDFSPGAQSTDRYIAEITVRSGNIVDGLTLTYSDGTVTKCGGGGGEPHSMQLVQVKDEKEYISSVRVRYGRYVQCLTFITNTGRQLGPCGGTGGFLLGFKGVEQEWTSPKPATSPALVGVYGRSGAYLDAIGFYWGATPRAMMLMQETAVAVDAEAEAEITEDTPPVGVETDGGASSAM